MVQVAAQQVDLRKHEEQCAARTAPQFEADPEVVGEVVGDDEVEYCHEDEKDCPGSIQAAPERVRHGQCAAKHFLDEVGLAHPLGDEQYCSEDEVNDARFPFDEHRVFQGERDAAEDEDSARG